MCCQNCITLQKILQGIEKMLKLRSARNILKYSFSKKNKASRWFRWKITHGNIHIYVPITSYLCINQSNSSVWKYGMWMYFYHYANKHKRVVSCTYTVQEMIIVTAKKSRCCPQKTVVNLVFCTWKCRLIGYYGQLRYFSFLLKKKTYQFRVS